MTPEPTGTIESAFESVPRWMEAWREHGTITILLDFDGTLAPIVERPEIAAITADVRNVIERLAAQPGAEVAIVSGRALEDVRARVAIDGIVYAGNHGMEIEGPGIWRMHPDAAAARPLLERVIESAAPAIASIEGATLEDKGLTLSIHYRRVRRDAVPAVRRIVRLYRPSSGDDAPRDHDDRDDEQDPGDAAQRLDDPSHSE
jgi:trehalose 6-phosphate phosphatase